MRVAYIVENYGVKSETFVTDLVAGLGMNGARGEIITDRSFATAPPGFQVVETQFCSGNDKLAVHCDRVGRLFKRTGIRSSIKKWWATKVLFPALSSCSPDVAYIDHGNNAVLARRALVSLGIPFVVHFHGRDASELLARPDYLLSVREVFRDACRIVVASRHIARRLVIAGCDEAKLAFVRLGLQSTLFPEPDWEQRRRLNPRIIHVGRLVEKKNPLCLLHAFAEVRRIIPSAELTVIGDGPLRSRVEETIARLGIESSVNLLGARDHEEVLRQICRHSVFAQHSVTDSKGDQEGFAISLLEAAAFGLPVVSTLHDGIPENVLDGETGFLVREYDYPAMAERIVQLLQDRSLAEKMGRAGRARACSEFTLERRAKAIFEILSQAATSSRRHSTK